MPSYPGLHRAWRPGLPWASMCRPPGFCRFAAVVDVVDRVDVVDDGWCALYWRPKGPAT